MDDTTVAIRGSAFIRYSLYAVANIPFVSKPPRGDGGIGERADRIQLQDVMPLVLDRLGLPRPAGIQGSIPPKIGRPLIVESYTLGVIYDKGDWLAIVDGDWKYMWNSKGHSALFDLATDPREERNLVATDGARAGELENRMSAYLAALPRSQTVEPTRAVDESTRDALKNLGYIE